MDVQPASLSLEAIKMTRTQFVTATWARRHVYEILDRVAAGASIVITRYGKPVAQIVPHGQRSGQPKLIEPFPDDEQAGAHS